MEIKNAFEAEKIEKELKHSPLYDKFLIAWSFEWFKYISKNILKNINEDWDSHSLTTNPNVTWELIKEYNDKDIPWYHNVICLNPNIKYRHLEEITKHNEKAKITDLQPEFVIHRKKKTVDLMDFVKNPNCSIEEILQKKPDILTPEDPYSNTSEDPADYFFSCVLMNGFNYRKYISQNPYVTWDYVLKHPEFNWNYEGLSSNPNITWDIVKNNKDKPWDLHKLSSNPNITFEILAKNVEEHLSLSHFTHNKNMTFEIFEMNPYYFWDFSYLSKNPNVSFEKIVDYIHPKIFFGRMLIGFSYNPNLTIDIIKTYEHEKWDLFGISSNKAITFDMIYSNQDIPWDDNGLSFNPNITWNEITNNKFKKNYRKIIENDFTLERVRWIQYKMEMRRKLFLELTKKAWHPDRFMDWCL